MSADAIVGYEGSNGLKSSNDAIRSRVGDKQHCRSLQKHIKGTDKRVDRTTIPSVTAVRS